MKKIITIFMVIVLAITGVYAYGNFGQSEKANYDSDAYAQRMDYQDMMYEIVENGTYDDLVQLREESGLGLARWVDSVEDFDLWQEKHEENEELGISGPKAKGGRGNGGHGMGQGSGYGRGSGNCMFE